MKRERERERNLDNLKIHLKINIFFTQKTFWLPPHPCTITRPWQTSPPALRLCQLSFYNLPAKSSHLPSRLWRKLSARVNWRWKRLYCRLSLTAKRHCTLWRSRFTWQSWLKLSKLFLLQKIMSLLQLRHSRILTMSWRRPDQKRENNFCQVSKNALGN